jgi:hypothetical protein
MVLRRQLLHGGRVRQPLVRSDVRIRLVSNTINISLVTGAMRQQPLAVDLIDQLLYSIFVRVV